MWFAIIPATKGYFGYGNGKQVWGITRKEVIKLLLS